MIDGAERELKRRLNEIGRVFKIRRVLSAKTDVLSVAKYYRLNKWSYSFFHDRDFIHMGLSEGGVFRRSDLLGQAKFVEKYVRDLGAKEVLELAAGRGANSEYLARRFPRVKFYGLDLADGQLSFAVEKAKTLNNLVPVVGDYHDLRRFKKGQFKVVFVIEALCHSENKQRVLEEVKRVLGKGGVFIVIDGYAKKSAAKMTRDERLASRLLARGMRVARFDYNDEFRRLVRSTGYKISFEKDATQKIMPTIDHHARVANIFFKLPQWLKRWLVKIWPLEFTSNVISAYLFPILGQLDVFSYEITVLGLRDSTLGRSE